MKEPENSIEEDEGYRWWLSHFPGLPHDEKIRKVYDTEKARLKAARAERLAMEAATQNN